MYAINIALGLPIMALWVAALPAPSPVNPQDYASPINPPGPYVSPFNYANYTLSKPPPNPIGEFHIVVDETNSTHTQLEVFDSVSDFDGANRIAHTNQRAICIIDKTWAQPGQHVSCFDGSFVVWYMGESPSTLTLQHFVTFQSNSTGISSTGSTSSGSSSSPDRTVGRGASEIPVFIDQVPEPKQYSIEEFDASDLFYNYGLSAVLIDTTPVSQNGTVARPPPPPQKPTRTYLTTLTATGGMTNATP